MLLTHQPIPVLALILMLVISTPVKTHLPSLLRPPLTPQHQNQISNIYNSNSSPILKAPMNFGVALWICTPLHILWVLSRNVNTINPAENFIEWQAAGQALNEYSVGIVCLQETNTQWSHPILHRLRQVMNKRPTKKTKIATSSSAEVIIGNYQPGGTCTITLGCWVSCACLAEQDSHGLGQWSYIEFKGRDERRIVVVSAYRSCLQQT